MKKIIHRTAAALLAAALLLGLTACHAGGEREIHKINWVMSPAYEAEDIALPVETGTLVGCCTDGETMYILAEEETEDGVRTVLCRASLGDGAVTVLEDYDDPKIREENTWRYRLGPVMAPDGTLWVYEIWIVSYYDLPEDFDPDKDFKGDYLISKDQFCHLCQLDPDTGRQTKLVDLSDAVQEMDMESVYGVFGFAVDGRNNIYLATSTGVAVLNDRSNLLFTLEADIPGAGINNSAGGRLALLPDGRVAALTRTPGGREVRTIDASSKSWGTDRYTLPNGVDQIYDGTGGFLFFYLSGGNFFGWEPEAEEGRLLLSRTSLDLEGGIMCFAPLDEGKLAALTTTSDMSAGPDSYWYSDILRLSMLTPSEKKPDDGKIKLVYGTFSEDRFLRYRISEFNRNSDRYYVELRNYSGEGVDYTGMNYGQRSALQDAARKLLNAEAASGKIPDIWDTSMPLDLYTRKGYFEDLWPWIDGDEELGGREALMSHVLECASIDEKLYKIANSFTITTAVALPEVVGDRTSWTLSEMLEIYRTMPEGSRIANAYVGGEYLLRDLLDMDMDHWVDWSAGTCSFDSPAFRELLELCAEMEVSEDYDYSTYVEGRDLREGRQLFAGAWMGFPEDVTYYEALCGGPEALWDYEGYLRENGVTAWGRDGEGNPTPDSYVLNDVENCRRDGQLHRYNDISSETIFGALKPESNLVYIGYPTESGTGSCFGLPSSYLNNDNAVSMSASCQNKEGAWAFMRQFLLEEDPEGVSLPGDGDFDGYLYRLYQFPINKAMFDRIMSPKWVEDLDGTDLLDSDGNRVEDPEDLLLAVPGGASGGPPTDMVVFRLAPSEEQLENFMRLYNDIDRVSTDTFDLRELIVEQAQPYFAGDKSLDETVDLIQRRAALYVNENR